MNRKKALSSLIRRKLHEKKSNKKNSLRMIKGHEEKLKQMHRQ